MISPFYKKSLSILVFVFALSFAFYFSFGNVTHATNVVTIGITNVRATNITSTSANIEWSTAVPANSVVILHDYATSINEVPVNSNKPTEQTTTHSIALSALKPNTLYTYTVTSKDLSTDWNFASDTGRTFRTTTGNASPTPSGEVGGDASVNTGSDLPGIDLTIDGVFRIVYGFACWLWSIAIVLLIIFIVLAGLRFMYAGDDPSKFTSAKTNFKYVILGAIVVMGTFVIISTVAYNIGANISFIPFNCSGSSSGPTGSGNTHDYQGVPGFQCYASQSDCQAAGETRCVECTTNQTCIDGSDCTVGNAITHFECGLDNVCRQVQGPGASDCKGNGEYCDTSTTPTPTLTQYLQCINNSCTYVNGLSGNLNNCVAEGDHCYNNGQ